MLRAGGTPNEHRSTAWAVASSSTAVFSPCAAVCGESRGAEARRKGGGEGSLHAVAFGASFFEFLVRRRICSWSHRARKMLRRDRRRAVQIRLVLSADGAGRFSSWVLYHSQVQPKTKARTRRTLATSFWSVRCSAAAHELARRRR